MTTCSTTPTSPCTGPRTAAAAASSSLFDLDAWARAPRAASTSTPRSHHVVEHGEIEVVYQPLVSLGDRRIVGAEALVRWNHPDHGLLLPEQFIQLAEDTGPSSRSARRSSSEACHKAKAWQDAPGMPICRWV